MEGPPSQENYMSKEDAEYQKFREEILEGAECLGSLSCEELNDRISRWALKDREGAPTSDQFNKWKARVKRQHKREARQYALDQREGKALPVRCEEVQTALSEFTKESSPPNEADLKEEVREEGEADGEDGDEGPRETDGDPLTVPVLLVDNMQDATRDAFCTGMLFGVSLSLSIFAFCLLCLKVVIII
jgi:hypothetical protein